MPMSPRLLRPRAAGNFATDTEARAYIEAVRIADGSYMERGVQQAIDAFIIGCKADGIWTPIKEACILMGARTLAGALTPLVGAAPTNNGPFVSGDYNRKTGLVGDGVGKFLDSNRNVNADPQNSYHQAVYLTTVQATGTNGYIGAGAAETGASQIATNLTTIAHRNRNTNVTSSSGANVAGLIGTSRVASGSYTFRGNSVDETVSFASQTPFNGSVLVFARNSGTNVAGLFTTARMAWYSLGESLTLSALHARLVVLSLDIGAAIP